MKTANTTIGEGVGNSQSLNILGFNRYAQFWLNIIFEVPGTLLGTSPSSGRRVKGSRAIGYTSGQRIGKSILVPESKGGIFGIPDFWWGIFSRITTNA